MRREWKWNYKEPGVIVLTETWPMEEIADSELALDGYTLYLGEIEKTKRCEITEQGRYKIYYSNPREGYPESQIQRKCVVRDPDRKGERW